jgi:hypothetical protein
MTLSIFKIGSEVTTGVPYVRSVMFLNTLQTTGKSPTTDSSLLKVSPVPRSEKLPWSHVIIMVYMIIQDLHFAWIKLPKKTQKNV